MSIYISYLLPTFILNFIVFKTIKSVHYPHIRVKILRQWTLKSQSHPPTPNKITMSLKVLLSVCAICEYSNLIAKLVIFMVSCLVYILPLNTAIKRRHNRETKAIYGILGIYYRQIQCNKYISVLWRNKNPAFLRYYKKDSLVCTYWFIFVCSRAVWFSVRYI